MNTISEILDYLRTARKTVATAESITAGYLQTILASVSGASDVFKGGITTYTLASKVDLLGVNQVLAETHNCIHEEIAKQMAKGALKLFGADYAIATCGYAELDGAEPYAFFAIADTSKRINHSERINLSGGRVETQKQTAQLALQRFGELLRNNS